MRKPQARAGRVRVAPSLGANNGYNGSGRAGVEGDTAACHTRQRRLDVWPQKPPTAISKPTARIPAKKASSHCGCLSRLEIVGSLNKGLDERALRGTRAHASDLIVVQ